ncbi:MAG: TonB-dependent receptor, partial [Bacteroidota bacterium]
MDNLQNFSTKEKALEINLRQDIYGSFAEIGAGQEVAANFFKAGGASGTVAKTMSAYDMSFSDAIYGTSERYVCEARLIKMLEKEYRLLSERLPHRAKETRFFAFANTLETLNYNKTNQAHGWIGVRFQTRPEGPHNECVIHIKMHDNDAILQQYAVGIVGVNLIYACLHYKDVGDDF